MTAIIIKIININNAIPTYANAGANTSHQDQAIKPIILAITKIVVNTNANVFMYPPKFEHKK